MAESVTNTMSTTKVNTWHLQSLLEGLEDALQVTNESKTQNEHGYPYCYGYLEATVSNAIFELEALLKNK